MDILTAQARLAELSEALELPLREVLLEYGADDEMLQLLEPMMADWGDRTLHEFVDNWRSIGFEKIDLINCDMERGNIFRLLEEIYCY